MEVCLKDFSEVRIFLIISLIVLSGCSAVGRKWILNRDTGDMELVEKIRIDGAGKPSVEFSTGGKISTDSGARVPDLPLR